VSNITLLRRYEEAVDAALGSKDMELAKFYAAKPEDGEGGVWWRCLRFV
jgi:hypothetical protein